MVLKWYDAGGISISFFYAASLIIILLESHFKNGRKTWLHI